MSHRKPPILTAEGGHSLRLLHVFGSPNYKPTHALTVLGWDADEATLRILRQTEPAWLQYWDAATGAWIRSVEVSTAMASKGVGVGTSQALVVRAIPGDADRRGFDLWDVEQGLLLRAMEWSQGAVGSIAASEDARLAVVAGASPPGVTTFALSDGTRGVSVAGQGPVAASADGSTFVSRALKGKRLIVRRSDGGFVAALAWEGKAGVEDVTFGRDGTEVVAGFSDGTVGCWEVATGTLRWRVPVHEAAVTAVRRSPAGGAYFSVCVDERLCATGGDGQRLWAVVLRRPRSAEKRNQLNPSHIVPSPSGALVAVTTRENTFRIFDAATGEERSAVDGHDRKAACLAMSPDARFVASGGGDGDVRVYDVATGEIAWVLEVDADEVTSVEFLPGGTALRTCGRDGVVRRWNLATGLEDAQWPVGKGDPFRARSSADGTRTLVRAGARLELWSELKADRLVWAVDFGARRAANGEAFADGTSRVVVCRAGEPVEGVAPWQLESFDGATGQRDGAAVALKGKFFALAETDAGPVSVMAEGDAIIVTEEWGERREKRFASWATKVKYVRLSADGRWLLVAGDWHVDVWALSPPRYAARVNVAEMDDHVTSLAMSADGAVLAVGTGRGCVLVLERGEPGAGA